VRRLFLLLPFALGCATPMRTTEDVMPCDLSYVEGTVVAAVGLTTRVGTQPVSDLDGWEWRPDDVFGLVDFGDEQNIEIEADGGDLFFTPRISLQNVTVGTPRYRSTIWVDTGQESNEVPETRWDLEGSALYFRWLPSINPDYASGGFADDWIGTLQLYDFDTAFASVLIEIQGSGLGAGQPSITFTIQDDLTTYDDEIAWDPDVHRWFKVAHDEGTGVITISTAGLGCDTWTERVTSGVAVVEPFSNLAIELTNTVDYTVGSPASPGYFGAFNQQPQERTVPLNTAILPLPKVPGSTVLTLDLTTELEAA
jgi:hypothetical protein